MNRPHTTRFSADVATLPDAPYVIGAANGAQHAVARWEAEAALTAGRPGWLVGTLCGRAATVAPAWGTFDRTNPRFGSGYLTGRCPYCGWLVALEQNTEHAEIAALAPAADELPALTRLLPDPYLAVRICEAILASDHWDHDHPHRAQLLGHTAAHAPSLLLPEQCAEGACDEAAEHGTCSYPDADVGCPACSVRAGAWAGEWEGQFTTECTATSPCDVLRTLARHYDVQLGT